MDWGKYYSARRILSAFPAAGAYDVYVEPMGGAAHVLMQKSPQHHVEIYNDLNQDVVNCWMWLRDQPQELYERLRSLPYSRALYYRYHASLYDGSDLDSLERAVRWFYVLRASFSGWLARSPHGWKSSGMKNEALSYQNA
ncbi:MAG: DNA adenine methylase, partial [Ktedonobacteraceae bacterium]|nr:DNA adenine methylase [Ktedonobacteraceae bacterium]